jgi:nucleotide-binding universal stress UspA family protein
MTEPIVVGVALRDDDSAPVALGRAIAGFMGATLALVHVCERSLRGDALAALAELAEPLRRELDVTLHAVPGVSPVRGLHEAAETLDAALLVLGSSHRGRLGRVMPGGVGERMLHAAPCAVAIAPRGYGGAVDGVRRIGVGFVDTPEGHEALGAAAALAVLGGATVSSYTVLEAPPIGPVATTPGWVPPPDDEPLRAKRAEAQAELARASVPPDVLRSAEVLDGDAAGALAAVSSELDLLICGSRGYGPLRAALLGGTSTRLAHLCACPLLIIPRAPRGALGAAGAGHGHDVQLR